LTVLANTYLPLLRVITGDTRQFKATLLILQGSRIGIELFMAIFQLQSQPHPNCYSKGNAVEIPPLIHLAMPRLKVAEVNNEESRRTPAQSLIDDYNKRKAATAHFPPKITPLHIRTTMRKYEQVVQEACAGVEVSCASCGEFTAKDGS
jgi:hypothetical protein